MIDQLLEQLDDVDPNIRQDAAIALGELGRRASETVVVLRTRLMSSDMNFHDRACAAWALARIAQREKEQVIADLIHVLRTERSTDANRLRHYCYQSIVEIGADTETIRISEDLRENDPYWQEVLRLSAECPEDDSQGSHSPRRIDQ